MSTSKLWIKYLGKLVILYLPLLLLILLFSMIDSTTYTYVPLFIQYIISTLENLGPGSANLPAFLTDFFASGITPVKIVLNAAVCLAIYQFFRCIFKFFVDI